MEIWIRPLEKTARSLKEFHLKTIESIDNDGEIPCADSHSSQTKYIILVGNDGQMALIQLMQSDRRHHGE